MARTLLLALLCALLAACAGGGPVKRVFPPEARVQELRIDGDSARLQLRVQNFSTMPSLLEGYSLSLEIADAPAVRLDGAPATALLPQAPEIVELAITLDPAALDRARRALQAGTALRYRLHGSLTVEPHGRPTPIDYRSALSPVPGLPGVLR